MIHRQLLLPKPHPLLLHPQLHPPHPQSPPNLSRPSHPHPQFAVLKSLILNPPIMMFTVHNMQTVQMCERNIKYN